MRSNRSTMIPKLVAATISQGSLGIDNTKSRVPESFLVADLDQITVCTNQSMGFSYADFPGGNGIIGVGLLN